MKLGFPFFDLTLHLKICGILEQGTEHAIRDSIIVCETVFSCVLEPFSDSSINLTPHPGNLWSSGPCVKPLSEHLETELSVSLASDIHPAACGTFNRHLLPLTSACVP